jgi:hypothetical protein
VYLQRIGFRAGSKDWLFVSDVPRSSWKVPVLTVSAKQLEVLLSHVQSDFTRDCNAFPPVFIRISIASRSRNAATFSLVTSSSVKSLSFDGLAFQPRWAANSPGVSGKVVGNDSEDAALASILAGRTRKVVVAPDVGSKCLLYSIAKGSELAVPPVGAPPISPWRSKIPVLSEYECFELHPAELARLEEHMNSGTTGSVFISVRYAGKCLPLLLVHVVQLITHYCHVVAPVGSVINRTLLRTPRRRNFNGQPVTRKHAQRLLWGLLHILPSSYSTPDRVMRQDDASISEASDGGFDAR